MLIASPTTFSPFFSRYFFLLINRISHSNIQFLTRPTVLLPAAEAAQILYDVLFTLARSFFHVLTCRRNRLLVNVLYCAKLPKKSFSFSSLLPASVYSCMSICVTCSLQQALRALFRSLRELPYRTRIYTTFFFFLGLSTVTHVRTCAPSHDTIYVFVHLKTTLKAVFLFFFFMSCFLFFPCCYCR